jgi:hypothetical protein
MTKKSQQKKREEDKYFDDCINEHLRILKQDEEKKQDEENLFFLKGGIENRTELKKLMEYFNIFELLDERSAFFALLYSFIQESLNKILKENKNCNGSALIQKIRDEAFMFISSMYNKDDGRKIELSIRGVNKKFLRLDLYNKFYKLFLGCDYLEDMVKYGYDDFKEDEYLYVLK